MEKIEFAVKDLKWIRKKLKGKEEENEVTCMSKLNEKVKANTSHIVLVKASPIIA